MSTSRMMLIAQRILDAAKANNLDIERLEAQLADQFPAKGMDTEAHLEIRRWAVGLYGIWNQSLNAVPKDEPEPEELEGKDDAWSLTIASLVPGMSVRIKEGNYYRWVAVGSVVRTGGDLRIILKRKAGAKYRVIEGDHLMPLQDVQFLLNVPTLQWERDYTA